MTSSPSPEQLVVEHLDWCRRIALKYARGFPSEIDFDDVIQDAYVGLIKAARSFDPARGVPFRGHAISRVRGEIADRLRQQAPGPRRKLRTPAEEALVLTLRFPLRLDEELDLDEVMNGQTLVTHEVRDVAAEHAFADVAIRDLTSRLPPRERLVLGMSDEGYTQPEIGAVLNVTASRVCQLRARAHQRLAALAA